MTDEVLKPEIPEWIVRQEIIPRDKRIEELELRPAEHLPVCRKRIYDPKSSPCTCMAEWDRLVAEQAAHEHE